METSGNTILITGGASGIGYALAEAFVKEGNEVIICGRREDKLEEAKTKLPQLHTILCDLEISGEREKLLNTITANFKNLNVLINNAGVQKMIDFNKGATEIFKSENELTINLEAPIHLSALFIEHLKQQEQSAIVNISSGLGFVPLAFLPVYCATKAALHSFTISLRHQLRNTNIKVFEIIPPTVDTELDKGRRKAGGHDRGISPLEVAVAALERMAIDEFEVAVGVAHKLVLSSRTDPGQAFKNINRF